MKPRILVVGAIASATVIAALTAVAGAGTKGKPFNTFRMATTPVDTFDPALANTIPGGTGAGNAYLPLLTYRRVNGRGGTVLVGAIASRLPTISNGGRTYTFGIRPDARYSDGSQVKASDAKWAIERLFLIKSPFVSYFSNISGTTRFGKTLKGGISGIVANDSAGTVTFHLDHPAGDFMNVMALYEGAPVPSTTPAKNQTTTPIPATGPLMIKSYTPGSSFVFVRNPMFKAIPGVPVANEAEVDGTIVTDADVALQMAIQNKVDYDQVPVPAERLKGLQAKYPSQLKFYSTPGGEMFFINQSKPPFNNLQARRALNYAIDRTAMVKLAGGLAEPTQNILPPSYPSYRKISYYHYNVAKAKSLIDAAGLAGTRVLVLGAATEESKPFVTYLAGQLQKIGLKPDLKIVSISVYFNLAGTIATKADTGWLPWNQDYPHPNDWFGYMFAGNQIRPVGNGNWGLVNIPSVNRAIAALAQRPGLTPAVNAAYAALDRELVVTYAAVAPYAVPVRADFFGPNVDTSCYVQLTNIRFDITQVCMK